MVDDTEITRVAAGLTRAQREAMLAGDVEPFIGHSPKLLRIAPGWKSREWNEVGEAVRDHILREKSGG